ncbi:MAG TPA: Uma2 family endonuclease, partial [Allocoleopsis sp.]
MTFTSNPIAPSPEAEIPMPPCGLLSDEPPLETDLHLQQIIALLESLNWLWRDRTDFYASGNLTIYYSAKKIKNRDFRGPDFFVVPGVERKPRKSWTVWEEDGKTPHV